MLTYRTYLRSFGSYNNMTTVTAFPHLNFTLLKYLFHFNVVKKSSISLLMSLLDGSYASELFGKFMETCFIGSFLWQLSRDGVTVDKLEKLSCKKLEEYLDFSNRFCGLSVQKHGAIDSYPTLPEMGL